MRSTASRLGAGFFTLPPDRLPAVPQASETLGQALCSDRANAGDVRQIGFRCVQHMFERSESFPQPSGHGRANTGNTRQFAFQRCTGMCPAMPAKCKMMRCIPDMLQEKQL